MTYFFFIKQVVKVVKKYGASKLSFIFIAVAAIPYGKMIFVPVISNLPNVKLSFVLAILSVVFFFRKKPNKYPLVILLIVYLFLGALFYSHPMSADIPSLLNFNSILRAFVLLFFILFSFLLIDSMRYKEDIFFLMKLFVESTFYTILVGLVMFIMLWKGMVTTDQLSVLIVAGDIHMVDNFFRFNPGHNVNEFSQILVYSIYLMLYLRSHNVLKMSVFHVALLMTLTRFTWISYILSLAAYKFKYFAIIVGACVLCLMLLYNFLNDGIKSLIESRFSFQLGVSGYERIEKFTYVYDAVTESVFRLMFGYGFSTNMYVHNVYLQLLYEIGLVGVFIFMIFLWVHYIRFMNNKHSLVFFVFILIESLAHHILFLGETWFALAMIVLLSRGTRNQGVSQLDFR